MIDKTNNKTNLMQLFLLVLLSFSPELKAESSQSKQHVFIISIDALAASHLQFYGYQRKTAPFLEQFARDNIIAEKAYANSAFTLNHVSMLTGVYPTNHGINYPDEIKQKGLDYREQLDGSIKTIAQLLQNNGYETFWIASTKDPYLTFSRGLGRGFKNVTEGGIVNSSQFPKITDNLAKVKDKNTFAFIHMTVHDPYLSPPPFAGYFDPLYQGKIIGEDRVFLSKYFPNEFAQLSKIFNNQEKTRSLFLKIGNEMAPKFWQQIDFGNQKEVEHLVSLYDDYIRYVDTLIERFFYALNALNMYDDSTIIITSDHGEAFGEHGGFRHESLHEEVLHVPLLIKIPGINNKSIKANVQTTDLVPTILDVLNLPKPGNLDGKSIIPLINENNAKLHKYCYASYLRSYSAWTDKWKLIHLGPNEFKLYNLVDDPFEKNNLMKTTKTMDFPDELNMALDRYIIRGNLISR